jgi:hypothetical protein
MGIGDDISLYDMPILAYLVNTNTMKKTKRVLFLLLFMASGWFYKATGQELSCNVSINIDQIQVNEQRGATQIYTEIQNVVQEFLNNRRWTNDNYSAEEKIKCSLAIIITKASASGDYEANARFQVTRPVYGTAYESVLLNYVDKGFNFKYLAGTPLNYNDNNYSDNLTQILAFYAYVALAFDYDSFAKLGGNNFAQKALNVVNVAQNAGGSWTASSDIRSRYWLAENLLNQQLQAIREGSYSYHRLAMDTFVTNAVESRKQILNCLNIIKQTNANRPGQLLVRLFFEAKSQELVNVFSDASPDERKKVSALLSSLDPTNSEAYRKLSK